MANTAGIKHYLEQAESMVQGALDLVSDYDNLADGSELEVVIEEAIEALARALQGAEAAWMEEEA